ncbi:hypothetical protein Scep_001561 [Stephania cephalantha]|uniref:GDSL esterase/lipase n=1 Tax=Stephania cephalantha TaxID=152367 RepID=A0AAP0L9A7_9MAGN
MGPIESMAENDEYMGSVLCHPQLGPDSMSHALGLAHRSRRGGCDEAEAGRSTEVEAEADRWGGRGGGRKGEERVTVREMVTVRERGRITVREMRGSRGDGEERRGGDEKPERKREGFASIANSEDINSGRKDNNVGVVCVVSVNLFVVHEVIAAPKVPCFFVFGDSLVDNRNNNATAQLAKANYIPYGIDYSNGPKF